MRLTLKSVLFNLLLVLPIFSFAAITEQDKANFDYIYGSDIKPEIYTKILNFCDKNDTDIDACLAKLKARSSEQKLDQVGYSSCCLNVSGHWGEYAYIHGKEYCIYPCE
ncbi:MAG: hypothetical protein Q8R79_03480 [Legionellaceae bacterium]|nr:hypothetical protein [Legionellaceae bacterium]